MAKATANYQIIRNGLVLDVKLKTVGPADILIKNDSIIEVGPADLIAPEQSVEIDATDRLLIPGLINAHTHGPGSLGKGLGDKWSLELLLNASPWISGGFSLEDKKTAASLNAAEMVLKGCTAAYDMYFEFPTPSVEGMTAVGQAYSDVGVKLVLAPMMADTTLYHAIPGLLDALPEPHRRYVNEIATSPPGQHLNVCRQLLNNWPFDRERVRPALGPTIPLHCSDDFIRGCRDLANEFDIGVQMHLAESKVQAISGLKKYGKTLTAHLNELGLISPKFTGAHCIWLDDDDLKLMTDRGAKIVHNPGSNLRLGSGIAPARQMINSKIALGIGTDGSASSDNQNMFEAMRMAAFVSRIVSPDPTDWLGTWDVLVLGTLGGAQVLGMENQIGQLASGFKADIVFLNLENINFVPFNDAANQIVNCEDSSAVDSVMIDGRMVLYNRKFVSLDYSSLRNKVESAVARLKETNLSTHDRMEAMASFVSHHCVGLTCQKYHVDRRINAPMVNN